MEGRSDLLKVFEANDLGNGLIDQILLRDFLVRAGCSALLVEQLFHLAGGDPIFENLDLIKGSQKR